LSFVAEQTRASIDIDASPDRVMAVIADFEHYPEWVDSMKSAEVLTSAGGKPMTVRMVLDHPLVKDDYVLGYDWEPTAVRWHLVEGKLLRVMDGSYELQPSDRGTTVTYTLTVDVNLPMVGMFKRKAEKTIIDGALQGLKRRVEN
jgi:ribosome-associated toxin RatA of RatAB toxin-antitoxin module